ncbi:MAG: hypothetical protein H0W37_10170 [Pseudonocardiales bacterium]|nr:hypothetical protein [Pseudonocardiales bacterium]
MTAVLVPQRGVLRAVRGATLAVASALLAGTAHVAAGGSAPDGALATLLRAMTAAHALAAVITALLLAGAESAVFTVAAAWRRIVAAVPRRVPSPLIPARRPVRPITPADVPAPLRVLLATLLRRRGPPVRS